MTPPPHNHHQPPARGRSGGGEGAKTTTVISVRGRIPDELRADPNFVYVGRQCAGWPRSIWGNPFKVASPRWGDRILSNEVSDVQTAVWRFETYLRGNAELMARLPELRGKVLGCWCVNWDGHGEPKRPCHAVVLARMVNPVVRTLFDALEEAQA